MALTCVRCHRINPVDAHFCFFDGIPLAGAKPRTAGQAAQFPTPFVFPDGRTCHTFDQLAHACQQNWKEAQQLLQQGFLASFLGGLGRLDLAEAARQAASFPDPDRGLDQLLGRLPTQTIDPPKLQAEPAEINLGALTIGGQHRFELHLANQGMRLLCGSLVSGTDWLALGDGAGQAQRLFQCLDTVAVPVQVRSQNLRAGSRRLEGKLIVESNGGTVTVRVWAEVPVKPFPPGVLGGATTPRQVALKAKEKPSEAAALFENGTVARWYQDNGWTYPVQGPAASGLGAVQQFFEALGVVKAPRVEVAETGVQLRGQPGEVVRHELVVRTAEKRPVFAHGHGTQPWLTVGKPQLNGATAILPLTITIPDSAPSSLAGQVRVQANGNQRFDVPVNVTVTAKTRPVAAPKAVATMAMPLPPLPELVEDAPAVAPLATASESWMPTAVHRKRTSGLREGREAPHLVEPIPAGEDGAGKAPAARRTARSRLRADLPGRQSQPEALGDEVSPGQQRRPLWLHAVPAAVLLLLLLVVLVADVFAPSKKVAVVDDTEERKQVQLPPPKITIEDEPDEQLRGAPTLEFKVDIQDEPEERGPDQPRKTTVEIKDEPEEVAPQTTGGKRGPPVDPTPRVAYLYGGRGVWGLRDASTSKLLTFSPNGGTNRTIARLSGASLPLQATGVQKRLPDQPGREAINGLETTYTAGPRFGQRSPLSITQILEIVPSRQPVDIGGGQQRRLLDTLLVRYILENQGTQPLQAGLRLEVDTLIGGNDGVPFTVPGRAGLVNTSADFTTPAQVPDFVQALERGNLLNPGTIVHITLKVGGGIEAPARVLLCHWASNGNLSAPRATGMGQDSAIIMIWPDQVLQPNQRREVGYAYGLGSVSAEARGTLGVTLGGNFDVGNSFTITAYVQNPVRGQTLTLEVPPGLERIKGEQIQNVQAPQVGNTSIVTWEAKVLQTGVFPLRVRSSTGVTQTKTITIAQDAPSSARLKLALQGEIEPGKEFTVLATVAEPAPGQTLSLSLPAGLQLAQGQATQLLPAPVAGQSQATWKVLVLRPGRYPVRVQSSTGGAQTKTITIDQTDQTAGRFVVNFKGDIAPAANFTVWAKVFGPVPGQTLTIQPPAGMSLLRGAATQAVPPAGADQTAAVEWLVKVSGPGKYPVEIVSNNPDRKRKKTIHLAEGADLGRFTLELEGDLKLGQPFTVVAKVPQPAPNQTLKINLPKELQLQGGVALQPVPPTTGGQPAPVRWTVLLAAPGPRLPVRVESSTGLVRTRSLSILGGDGTGIFR